MTGIRDHEKPLNPEPSSALWLSFAFLGYSRTLFEDHYRMSGDFLIGSWMSWFPVVLCPFFWGAIYDITPFWKHLKLSLQPKQPVVASNTWHPWGNDSQFDLRICLQNLGHSTTTIQGGPLPVISRVITPYKWPYKWLTWVITLLITGRGPTL